MKAELVHVGFRPAFRSMGLRGHSAKFRTLGPHPIRPRRASTGHQLQGRHCSLRSIVSTGRGTLLILLSGVVLLGSDLFMFGSHGDDIS